ncbi:MAG: excinuclease ABC subunit UvrC [Candidatus Glassbacteria bacterium]|nr:excinuclease ABC subunit UvrC [Candidatus Glassbacteria bacterium]
MAGQNAKCGSESAVEQKLSTLPMRPGVYMMRDEAGKIIYVGKAKKLANRVRSYFRGTPANPKVAAMVSRIATFDYLVTDSEIEALLLECNLIKEHRPRYNVDLKDDKRYPFLKVTTAEPFPRAFVTRKYSNDGSRYFGPYTDAGALRTTLEVLGKVFPLRTCRHKLPEQRGARECLNFHLGHCSAPCHGHITEADYAEMVAEVIQFLEGRTEPIADRLRHKMKAASEGLDFELAARCRDQLKAVEKVSQRQRMDAPGGEDADVVALSVDGRDACAVVFKIRGGKMLGSEHRLLRNNLQEPPEEVLNAFIGHTYLGDREYPPAVYLSHRIEDAGLYEKWLSQRSGRKVRLHVPERGDKVRLVRMAERNSHLLLEEVVMHREQARQRVPEALLELQKTLGLKRLPRLIVCFDVSTIQGSHAVAAMSCSRNGKPLKSAYRKFRIRRESGQDDFAMMKEAVGRYFSRVAGGEIECPHLVVIDGGKGQLGAAVEAISETGLELPQIVALAKREEELYLPGNPEPFGLSRRSEALRMLMRVRDEAHRFAVEYHRKVRSKNTLDSKLNRIPGIGPSRTAALLEEFGSPAAVARASVEQLSGVKGFSQAMARKVADFLNDGKSDARSAQDSA